MKTNALRSASLVLFSIFSCLVLSGQEVPILKYNTNSNGQVQLTVKSSIDNYYILKIRHEVDNGFDLATSMTKGDVGQTIITEPLGAYPIGHYLIQEFNIDTPADIDNDGFDDISEFQKSPLISPLNFASLTNIEDGFAVLDSFKTFKTLSVTKEKVQWSEFLNGKTYVKFLITDFDTEKPKIYFINSETHNLHEDFAKAIGVNHLGDQVVKGQIIYHPTIVSNNGKLGTFTFNYSSGKGQSFRVVRRTHELLASNMPLLENNFAYYITALNESAYTHEVEQYQKSRISVLFDADVFAEIDYWGLNPSEGYGFFTQGSLEEIPGPKDIVLYESLPNSLPRVGGIITTVLQTPLSHVNLRAIQNGVPNAFIKDPLSIDSINQLLDHYIYFKVEQDGYIIREATIEEVNVWYEELRPEKEQIPLLNLDYTSILHLDDISFEMFDGYGAKCTNLATMRTFGFSNKTIPDGYGIPFYFYQEFMTYNHFFEDAALMIESPDFISNREIRDTLLKAFRKKIKKAEMPNWMMNELEEMHQSFAEGTPVRCRSSTNNEDLPGFNGAGLYDSKTHYQDEGHIAKSIKQVFASLWNLRAFEEREFYRINHFAASMGVLCHPNYSDEKANGVGISIDPLYNTANTYYLNSQLGEDLITNPSNTSIPEEILLDKVAVNEGDYLVVQRSNLIPSDTLVMNETYLDQMRSYLTTIHDEFEVLYDAVGNETFAMDIEYKITSEDQLIIKQARPWVEYKAFRTSEEPKEDDLKLKIFPNPAHDIVNIQCKMCTFSHLRVIDMIGNLKLEKPIEGHGISLNTEINIEYLPAGIYMISGFSQMSKSWVSGKFVKY